MELRKVLTWKRYIPLNLLLRTKCLLLLSTFTNFSLVVVIINNNNEISANTSKRISEITSSLRRDANLVAIDKPEDSGEYPPHSKCQFVSHRYFPLCQDKLKELQNTWNSSLCYIEQHHIDGSQCSLAQYLIHVEPYCAGEKEMYQQQQDIPLTIIQHDIKGLLNLLPGKFYKWMRRRATFLWKDWQKSVGKFTTMANKKKTVVVFLAGVPGWFMEMADKGGPLGELVQWTDVLTALYTLGYDVHVVKTIQELHPLVKDGLDTDEGCARGNYPGIPDVIYGDITSFKIFQSKYGEKAAAKFRCRFRILDVFGTFVEFNYPAYPHHIPGGRSWWGNLNMIPTQFLTLYPHTQDNSYLGFVVSSSTPKYNSHYPSNTTKPKALLYAKDGQYLRVRKETKRYLEIVSEYFDIEATCGRTEHYLPPFVHNHGAVSGERIQQLLSQSKLFLGVGHPYEGPGPIEAMANGAVYLQPKFSTQINEYAGKPTLRKLESQNPYMEEFVGKPYCHTIDVTDENLLRSTLQQIKSMKRLPGKIPKDFTHEGMLERIHVYTQRMDLCNPFAPRWPPTKHLKVYMSAPGESCKEVCMSQGRLCERTFFEDVNSVAALEKYTGVRCGEVVRRMLLHAPSVHAETGTCHVQTHAQLFSCMHGERGIRRLCPCRDYEPGHSAVCNDCIY